MLPSCIRVIVRDWLVNTHFHFDPMGGNAAVQYAYLTAFWPRFESGKENGRMEYARTQDA